jgi:adenine-specific DNA-methyltransferase
MAGKKTKAKKQIETLTHPGEKRKNIPTAEIQSVMEKSQQEVQTIRYPRNTDLDPQIVWRGKDEQDWSDLIVHAPPLYIQEKVHPKVLIDDLGKWSVASGQCSDSGHQSPNTGHQLDLFGDFNGVPEGADKTEFYAHDQNWSNRMILGDSLQVMASLAERAAGAAGVAQFSRRTEGYLSGCYHCFGY